MMLNIIFLRIVKTVIVVLGTILVYLAAKGYRRTKSKAMIFLSLGFALVTIGSVLAGVLFEFLGFELIDVSIIESFMIILGFACVIYSIYGFD